MIIGKMERILVSFKPEIKLKEIQTILSQYKHEEVLGMERTFHLYVPAGELFDYAGKIEKQYGHLFEHQELVQNGQLF